jgi:micrococcal nuclease
MFGNAVSDEKILAGKVVSVIDGDTVIVLSNNKQFKIRLTEIDSPENGQPYGNKAKVFLHNLVFNRSIKVHITGIDKYQRILGYLYLEDINVNYEIVKNGYAWQYTYYSNSAILHEYENYARVNKLGLWKDDVPIKPWEWRNKRR